MAISREEVERIADLARLEIPEDRVERMRAELSAVLEFVATLNRLDLTGCEISTFAPADAPRYAIAVIIERGGDLGNEATGGKVAAPVAADVLKALLEAPAGG